MSHELPLVSPDGSFQLGPTGPLRLVRNTSDGVRRVYSSSELIGLDESVAMSKFPGIAETVRFSITDCLTPQKGFLPFVRDILYTRAGEKRIMTMTGYLMSATNIQIVSPYFDKNRDALDAQQRARIKIGESIEMEHIQGFDAAVARHQERVSDLKVTPANMNEALDVYNAVLYCH